MQQPTDQASQNGLNGSSNNIMRFFANLPGALPTPQPQQQQPQPTAQMPPGLFPNLPAQSGPLPGFPANPVNQNNLAGQHLLAMLGRAPSSQQIPSASSPSTTFSTPPGVGYPMPQQQYSSPIAILQAGQLSMSSDQLRGSSEIRTQAARPVVAESPVPTAIPSSPVVGSPMKKNISSSLETSLPSPQGVYLTENPSAVTINRTEHKGRAKKPLEVNQITIYNQPDVSFKLGSSITVNNHFICYVVKQNLIRTIQISTSAKALLKGHTSDISDLRFAADGANRFVSADVGGTFIVWDLKETGRTKNETTGAEEAQLEFAKTLVVDVPEGSGLSLIRTVWHPMNPGVIATAYSDNHVILWSVPLLKEQATSVVDATGNHFTARRVATAELPSFQTQLKGVLAVINVSSPIHDLSFSADGLSLAVGSMDGYVRLFSAETGALSREWQPHGGAPVFAAQFLHTPSTAGLILTGGFANDQLSLWSAKTFMLLQTLTFEPASSETTTALPKTGQRIHFDRSGQFLAVAHNAMPFLHVFHLHVPATASEAPRFDYMCEFGLGAVGDDKAGSPVLSFVFTNHKPHLSQGAVADDSHMQLFCAQSKYIQMYRLHASQCYAGPLDPPAPAPVVIAEPVSEPATPASTSEPVVKQEIQLAPGVADPVEPAPPTPAIIDSVTETTSDSSQDTSSSESQPKQDRQKQKKDKQKKPKEPTPAASPANGKYKAKPKDQSQPSSASVEGTAPAPAPTQATTSETAPQTAATRVANNNKRRRTKSQLDADTSRDTDTAASSSASTTTTTTTAITLPPAPVLAPIEVPLPAVDPVNTEGLDSNSALMLRRMETLMKQQNDYFVAQLERQRREFERSAEERQQALLQAFVTSLNSNLEQLIQKQIKANFQSLGKIMSSSMESMLTSSLTDSFKKAIKDGLRESQSTQAEDIAARITEPVGQQFRTHFSSVLAPSFEKALQVMFTQIANTMEQGIQQYTTQFASVANSSATTANAANPTTQLSTAVTTLVDISERMNKSLVDTQSKLVSTLLDVVGRARSSSSGSTVARPVASKTTAATPVAPTGTVVPPERLVTSRPKTAKASEASSTSSNINTPPFPEVIANAVAAAPVPAPAPAPTQPKSLEQVAAELQQAVAEEKYEESLTIALAARNLEIVQSLCTALHSKKEDVIPKLSQRVLISLVQQLSADLTTATQLKLEWVHIAVPLIDVTDTLIAPHVGKVLGKLQTTLEAFLPIYEKTNVVLFNLVRGTLIHTKSQLRKHAASPQQ